MSENAHPTPGLALHERALAVGLELLDQRQAVIPTLDEVAARLDVPRAALERLFANDQALFEATLEDALIHLMDTCTRAVVRVDPSDAFEQSIALGNAFLTWAAEYQMQFRLLVDGRAVDAFRVPRLRRYIESIHELLVRMLARAQEQGQLHPKEDVAVLAVIARSFAYGLAWMIVDGRTAAWFPGGEPLDAARDTMTNFVRRLARASRLGGGAGPAD